MTRQERARVIYFSAMSGLICGATQFIINGSIWSASLESIVIAVAYFIRLTR